MKLKEKVDAFIRGKLKEQNWSILFDINEDRVDQVIKSVEIIEQFIEERNGFGIRYVAHCKDGELGLFVTFDCKDMSMHGTSEIIDAIRDAQSFHISAASSDCMCMMLVFGDVYVRKKYI